MRRVGTQFVRRCNVELAGVRPDLIVEVDSVDPDRLLECWRWRIGPSLRPWFATVVGDLFLRGPTGDVAWLDAGVGEVETAAPSEAAFHLHLADPQRHAVWFAPTLVDRLRDPASGQPRLQPGEVFSYLRLPLLGGDFAPANFRVRELVDHFCTLGMLHRQFHENPDGAGLQFGPDE